MHSTVREFSLGPNGSATMSKFSMSHHHAHTRKSVTCLQCIMLCSPNNALDNDPPSIDSWTAEHIESYTRYLDQIPFINYALSHLKHHWIAVGRMKIFHP
jgi:hypothetical protein